jgi:hypothetical protein
MPLAKAHRSAGPPGIATAIVGMLYRFTLRSIVTSTWASNRDNYASVPVSKASRLTSEPLYRLSAGINKVFLSRNVLPPLIRTGWSIASCTNNANALVDNAFRQRRRHPRRMQLCRISGTPSPETIFAEWSSNDCGFIMIRKFPNANGLL